jgi:hypothetical protein
VTVQSTDRMHVLQVRSVVLILAQTKCDKDTIAVLIKDDVQKCGR